MAAQQKKKNPTEDSDTDKFADMIFGEWDKNPDQNEEVPPNQNTTEGSTTDNIADKIFGEMDQGGTVNTPEDVHRKEKQRRQQ